MEEFDGVELIEPFEDLQVGMKGTIVIKYNEKDYEVEFFDENHDSIGVYTIPGKYIKVYWKYSEHKDS